jgi:hypothetical protein
MDDFEVFMEEIGVTKKQLQEAKDKMMCVAHAPGYLYIGTSDIEGEGVFTAKTFLPGRILDTIWRDGWTQTGLKMNHAKHPNCKLIGTSIVTKKTVIPKQELTLDYRQVREALT